MERTLEELEKQSWDKINVALKNNEAQEEQDDSVICDVCRSVSFFTFKTLCHSRSEQCCLVKTVSLIVLRLNKTLAGSLNIFL